MNNFAQRTVFGSIYVAVIVLSCLVWQPYLLGVVFLLVSMLAMKEYTRMMQMDMWTSVGSILLSGLLFAPVWRMSCPAERLYSSWILLIGAPLYLLLLAVLLLGEIFRKTSNPIQNWGNILIGQLWIAFPFALMGSLGAAQPMLLLSLFVVIWVNDTGAYCVGSLIGKHKMIPRVSPGKSWEGLIGGIVFAMGAGYIFLADPFDFTGLYNVGWRWIVLTLVITIFGTLGDLLESRIKRTLGVKDSGNAIPGHGGWLDRFDSALVAVVALFLTYFILH